MDMEQARFNMLEQQIRTWDVLAPSVLNLLKTVHREEFVPEEFQSLAFADTQIPLAHGQVMMPPREEARLIQALSLSPQDKVLEIGTGSGYVTALLASVAESVCTVELHQDFSEQAATKLAQQGLANVEFQVGDGAAGWGKSESFDAIAITGSLPVLPEAFLAGLKMGGRLFAVIGEAPAMVATLYTRVAADDWRVEPLFETVLQPLETGIEKVAFQL